MYYKGWQSDKQLSAALDFVKCPYSKQFQYDLQDAKFFLM